MAESSVLVVAMGHIVREQLPLPIVYYPNHYGTFHAFAEDESSLPYLCSCTEVPVRNLLCLQQRAPRRQYANRLRMAPLDSWFFPDVVARTSLDQEDDPLSALKFQSRLCHRCNLNVPQLAFCHPMYEGEFRQRYGWYINQTCLRFGVMPDLDRFLPDVCPPEYQQRLLELEAAREAALRRRLRANEIASGPNWQSLYTGENVHIRKEERASNSRESHLRRELANLFEDITREEFGYRKVGEGWVSETLLFQIVSRVLRGHEILRHFRPEWLEGLELDIYVPSLRLAIEYQGQQHFQAVEAWGGELALQALQERDARKADLCRSLGIRLTTFTYMEPLTDEYVEKILRKQSLD